MNISVCYIFAPSSPPLSPKKAHIVSIPGLTLVWKTFVLTLLVFRMNSLSLEPQMYYYLWESIWTEGLRFPYENQQKGLRTEPLDSSHWSFSFVIFVGFRSRILQAI
ncbi:hypothetical protein CDAR_611791 [Caerostris darwini]|uniref:Uncharacterized protein n=1 Tax=Caerostris darwini TaxID=1538125 RepID=A0AAV4MSL1_9ARAC|nr:hypothetical protein CDAR_611791 [Caerostris darwini]